MNADEAAIPIALGVGADRLLLLSDVPGVLAGGELLETVDRKAADELTSSGALAGGMLVKVNQALEAANAGVEVRIGDAGLLAGGSGTRILGSELSAASA